jgi:hypothetical protein
VLGASLALSAGATAWRSRGWDGRVTAAMHAASHAAAGIARSAPDARGTIADVVSATRHAQEG